MQVVMLMVVEVGLPSINHLPIFADFIHHPGCSGNSGFQNWVRQLSRHYQFKEGAHSFGQEPFRLMCLETESWIILKLSYTKKKSVAI